MIPCYNHADLLAATLESVLVQDPGPALMQIEVVDDASSVGDPEKVIRSVAGSRVGLYRQARNVGAASNFTTCIRRSTGRWVHILHADDLVEPTFYETYAGCIENSPEVVMVGGGTLGIDKDGNPTWPTLPVETVGGLLVDPAFTMASVNPLRCVSAVVRRASYERWGGFRPELVHANDWEMWTRLASHGDVGWVDKPQGRYRQHDASDSTRQHRSTRYVHDCLRAVDTMATYFPDADRNTVRTAARRNVCGYALSVGTDLLERGDAVLAARHAIVVLSIDRSAPIRRQAGTILREAAGAVFRR